MLISLLVAIDENKGIGKNNNLPWHLPADLKHFKRLTSGHTVIMGRKTYESIGKALPNRRNIVITRNARLKLPDAEVVTSLDRAFELAKDDTETFVIGGAQIFHEAWAKAERLYLTLIHHSFEADTFLNDYRPQDWIKESETRHDPDEKNAYSYTFLTLRKA